MGVIRRLEPFVAAQVAAGEVIESPAAVVRELVDNSLDAGAQKIGVSVEKGGVSRLVVKDDGKGMGRDDLELAFERHATSKICRAEDLLAIQTLGFRGEALPSIIAVSRGSMRSALHGEEIAWRASWSGGKLEPLQPEAAFSGTKVEVEELFFNLPGRRKFLGSAAASTRQIDRVLRAQALAFPEVAFEFKADGKLLWRCEAREDFVQRANLLAAGETELWPVKETMAGIGELSGLVSAPGACRRGRRLHTWILHRRSIQSELLSAALRRAYGASCAAGESPVAILRFQPASTVAIDWNVHPAKQEVKFAQPQRIEQAIEKMLVESLASNAGKRRFGGEVKLEQEEQVQTEVGRGQLAPQAQSDSDTVELSAMKEGAFGIEKTSSLSKNMSSSLLQMKPQQMEWGEEILGEENKDSAKMVYPKTPQWLGLLPPEFALLEQSGGLLIADLRAVLERLAAQRLEENVEQVRSQLLLLPLTVDLPAATLEKVKIEQAQWQEAGWELQEFGANTLLVSAVPANWPTLTAEELPQLFEQMAATKQEPWRIRHCRSWAAAMLKESELDAELAQAWIAELWQSAQPYLTPSGRATVWWISERELFKRFQRS